MLWGQWGRVPRGRCVSQPGGRRGARGILSLPTALSGGKMSSAGRDIAAGTEPRARKRGWRGKKKTKHGAKGEKKFLQHYLMAKEKPGSAHAGSLRLPLSLPKMLWQPRILRLLLRLPAAFPKLAASPAVPRKAVPGGMTPGLLSIPRSRCCETRGAQALLPRWLKLNLKKHQRFFFLFIYFTSFFFCLDLAKSALSEPLVCLADGPGL